jgi:hypothetical protein
MNTQQNKPPMTLYFGRHRGQALDAVPSSYLTWVLETKIKLSSGLKSAVLAELQSRGISVTAWDGQGGSLR